MPEIVEGIFSQSQIADLIEESQYDLLLALAKSAGHPVHEGKEISWIGDSTSWPRGIFRACFSGSAAEEQIRAMVGRIRAKEAPSLWLTGPTAQPEDLEARLELHGFVQWLRAAGMAVEIAALRAASSPPAGFEVRVVADEAMLRAWVRILTLNLFRMPEGDIPNVCHAMQPLISAGGLKCFLGLLDGQPVSTASLFLARGVAGLYHVATDEKWRKQGIGAQMVLAPMRDARTQGYRVGILQSAAMAETLYQSLGFREYCRLGRYLYTNNQG
jgi:GNAT superfamily N-acetyltransferase